MKLGFIGLGKMGGQMVSRLLQAGHEVLVTDINPEAVESAVSRGAIPAIDRTDMLNQLNPVIVWLMIPAENVDAEIDALLNQVPPNSIIIDGGNSNYRHTIQRAQRCHEKQVRLIDVGTSGGVLGLKGGFSMMVGGDPEAFKIIEPIIKSLAQESGYGYFGPSGSGHYIKMVHNGIEYGIMQSYAEGYSLLKEGEFPDIDLAAVSEIWQHGSIIKSELNAIAGQILKTNPNLEGIEGQVAETGEGRWTLEAGQTQGVDLPVLAVALEVRAASRSGKVNYATRLLAAMRNVFGGHAINKK